MAASAREQDAQGGRAGTRDTVPGSGPPMLHSATWMPVKGGSASLLVRITVVLEGPGRREVAHFERIAESLDPFGWGDRFTLRRFREDGPGEWADLGETVCRESLVAAACGVSSLGEIQQVMGAPIPIWPSPLADLARTP